MAKKLVKYKAEGEAAKNFPGMAKELEKQVKVVAQACGRKNGDVQATLSQAHDALEAMIKSVSE